jgi:acetyl esterase/lipase
LTSPALEVVRTLLLANPPIQGETILEQRAFLVRTTANLPRPDDVRYEPVDAGGAPAEWVTAPESRPERVLVHLHGGAYVMGSPESHRPLATRLARAARARVLLVDYRLAPEHPHPAAVEDAVASFHHVLAGGLAAQQTAICGDSAGGGLAAAALVALRDAGGPLPVAAALLSPWLDLTLSGKTVKTRADADPLCSEALLRPAAEAYAKGTDLRAPTVSPVFADLAGLPPLLVQVGDAEILLDDSRRFAERARAAGVDVELEVADEMIHVWHAFADILPEACEAIDRVAAFLERRWR